MSENNVDYSLVKKPHHDRPLTESEVQEFMRCRNDFWYFATNHCKVLGPKGLTYFEPRDYQVDMMNDIKDNTNIVVNAPRQCGKCIGKHTKYTVKHKNTGEIYELTAEEFHTMVKDKRDS